MPDCHSGNAHINKTGRDLLERFSGSNCAFTQPASSKAARLAALQKKTYDLLRAVEIRYSRLRSFGQNRPVSRKIRPCRRPICLLHSPNYRPRVSAIKSRHCIASAMRKCFQSVFSVPLAFDGANYAATPTGSIKARRDCQSSRDCSSTPERPLFQCPTL